MNIERKRKTFSFHPLFTSQLSIMEIIIFEFLFSSFQNYYITYFVHVTYLRLWESNVLENNLPEGHIYHFIQGNIPLQFSRNLYERIRYSSTRIIPLNRAPFNGTNKNRGEQDPELYSKQARHRFSLSLHLFGKISHNREKSTCS